MRSELPKLKLKRLFVLTILSFSSFYVQADWRFAPAIETRLDAYDRTFENGVTAKDEVLSLEPKLNAIFDGHKVDGSFSVKHTRILPNDDELSKARSYTSYGVNAKSEFLDNLLKFQLMADQDYLVRDPSDSLSSSTVTAPERFTKVRRMSGSLLFSLPNPVWFGMDMGGQASKSEADAIEGPDTPGFNNETYGANVRFYRGKNIRYVDWNISASYNNTKREVSDDFESRVVNAKFSFPLFMKDLRFVLTGQDEKNEFGSNRVEFSDAYDQTSYGAGLEWFVSDSRYITVTVNRIEKSLNDQEQDYLGLDLKWAFSSRTSIGANYGKRFYGDSYDFSLIHSTRDIRTLIGYHESITTRSRITQNNVDMVIVCPVGDTQFENCFQPEVGYELLPGEQSFDFQQQVPELSEEVYLRKSANIDLSWTRRKLTLGIGANKGSTDYLESNRQRDNQSIAIRAIYKLNRTTDVNFSANVAEYQFETEEVPDKTQTVGLGLTKELGRNITTSVNLRYLDRDSSQPSNTLIDKRISASLTYNF